MEATQYKSVLRDLNASGLLVPKNSYGFATIAVETSVFICGAFALSQTAVGSVPWWMLQVFLGASMFRFFVIGHECGHNSLFTSQRVSTLVGLYASVFSGVPYIPWRNVHRQHHQWVGVIDKDPTQAELLGLRRYKAVMNGLFRFVWVAWVPVMFLVFLVRSFYLYPFVRAKEGQWRLAIESAGSVLICIAPKVVLCAVLGWEDALILLLPMVFVFLFIDENVSLPQHTGLFPFLSDSHPRPIPYAEQDEVTRTTSNPGWVATLLALNFNLHTEHHLFPGVPWYWLPQVTRRIRNERTYQRVHFATFMFGIRTRDPVDVFTRALPLPQQEGATESDAPPNPSSIEYAHNR